MFIRISGPNTEPTITLREPDDFRRLHVEVSGLNGPELKRVIRSCGLGQIVAGSTQLQLSVRSLRNLAGEQTPRWHDDFNAMLEYADAHGWMPDRDSVLAHYVRS